MVGVIEGVLKAAGRFGFILDKTVEAREESIFVFDKEVFIFIPQDGGDKVNIFLVFIFYVIDIRIVSGFGTGWPDKSL